MLKISDLEEQIKGLKLKKKFYRIGDIAEKSLCIIQENSTWHVFFYEYGRRHEERVFTDEEEACHNFLERFNLLLVRM